MGDLKPQSISLRSADLSRLREETRRLIADCRSNVAASHAAQERMRHAIEKTRSRLEAARRPIPGDPGA